MKVAILAGGQGTRMGTATADTPKPMLPIGGQPILRHIMNYYASYGFRDFVIATGHNGQCIRDYFAALDRNKPNTSQCPDCLSQTFDVDGLQVTLVDTGATTNTGGRVKRLASTIGRERFLLTWGDGLADVDLDGLTAFHDSHGRLATVTAVRPPERFGRLELNGHQVTGFFEKQPRADEWINGAFFVLEPEVFDLIEGDQTSWEDGPMHQLAESGQLAAWKHESFWQCMDTPKEQQLLERHWASGSAPWRRS
jgi:glucose-1-phosphate cytidylyltransferase